MTPPGGALSSARPFPGLRPYEFADRDYFFGREDQAYALYRLIDSSGFVAAIGSSGSGKSSLVLAGLLPLLKRERKEGGRDWRWEVMRPGDAPLDNLADLLAGLSPDTDEAVRAERRKRIDYNIRRSSFGMIDALREIDGFQDKKLFLVVDQFEELFRFAKSGRASDLLEQGRARDAAAQFVQILLEAERDPSIDIHVLITMRSDFIGDCARFHGLPDAVSACQFLVPALTRSQLEDVIVKPVEKAGASIEPELVQRLLNDSGDEMDQLPVLQHCLMRLWDEAGKRGGAARRLTRDDYERVGGVNGALSRHADEILEHLAVPKLAVEQVFRALGDVDKEGRAIRRALPFAQLLAETGSSETELRAVLDRFRADDCSFLNPSTSRVEALRPATRIDVGHEALLRKWRRVWREPEAGDKGEPEGWLQAEAADGRRYSSLAALLDGDSRTITLPGERVTEYAAWWNARPRSLAWTERYGGNRDGVVRLLDDSLAALTAERRRAQRWRQAFAIAAIFLGLATIFMTIYSLRFLNQKREQAETAARLANAQKNDEELKKIAANAQKVLAERNYRIALETTEKNLADVATLRAKGDITLKGALDLVADASAAIDKLPGAEETDETQAVRAQILLSISMLYADAGDTTQALTRALEADALARRLEQSMPDDPNALRLRHSVATQVGYARALGGGAGALVQAEKEFRDALQVAEHGAAIEPQVDEWRVKIGLAHGKIGDALSQRHQNEAAKPEYQLSVDLLQDAAAKNPQRADWQGLWASAVQRLGRLQLAKETLDQSLPLLESALHTRQTLVANEPNNDTFISNLTTSYADMAKVLEMQGQWDLGAKERQKLIEAQEGLVKKDVNNAMWKSFLASDYLSAAIALESQNQSLQDKGLAAEDIGQKERQEKIIKLRSQALAIRQELADRDPGDISKLRSVASNLRGLADAYFNQRQRDAAIENYRAGIEAWKKILLRSTSCTECNAKIMEAEAKIAEALASPP